MRLDELTVEDLMSVALVTVRKSESIRRADLSMRYADIRHLPVLDETGRLVGIVSDRDLLRAFAHSRQRTLIRVGDIMTRRLHTVRPETPAWRAAGLLLQYRISALPVVDRPRHLVGLVTETDFLRVFRLVGERSRGGSDLRETAPHAS